MGNIPEAPAWAEPSFSPSLFYSLVFSSPMAIPMAVTDWKEQAVFLNLCCSLVSISCLLVVLTGVLIPSSTNWIV